VPHTAFRPQVASERGETGGADVPRRAHVLHLEPSTPTGKCDLARRAAPEQVVVGDEAQLWKITLPQELRDMRRDAAAGLTRNDHERSDEPPFRQSRY
jgi:hypothetical protein